MERIRRWYRQSLAAATEAATCFALGFRVRKEVMQRHPEFATLFDPIIERLDDATMQALNARVDIEQQTPQKVAADFLREHRLLDDGQAGQGGSQ